MTCELSLSAIPTTLRTTEKNTQTLATKFTLACNYCHRYRFRRLKRFDCRLLPAELPFLLASFPPPLG